MSYPHRWKVRPMLIGKLSKGILERWWRTKNLNAKIPVGRPTCPSLLRTFPILALEVLHPGGLLLSPGQFQRLDHPWFKLDADGWEITRVKGEGRQPRCGPRHKQRPRGLSLLRDTTFEPYLCPTISSSPTLTHRVLREEDSVTGTLHATGWCMQAHRPQVGLRGTNNRRQHQHLDSS